MMTRTGRLLLAATLLTPVAACSERTTTDERSYRIDDAVTALVVDARAATVAIETGAGPVTVREVHRFSAGRPATAHAVDGGTLRLTESGCDDDDARCDVEFHLRMPAATSADITSQAGVVKIDGLTGNVRISSQAAAVEGTALGGDEVTVETEAGAASLEFAEAPALARVTSDAGAVTVRVPDTAAYAVRTETGMGATRVSVRKDSASPHRIEVRTGVGAVQIEPLS